MGSWLGLRGSLHMSLLAPQQIAGRQRGRGQRGMRIQPSQFECSAVILIVGRIIMQLRQHRVIHHLGLGKVQNHVLPTREAI